MTYDPELHNRRSIRMPGYDYTSAGWYYVTLCVQDRIPNLSKVINDLHKLTDFGRDVEQSLKWLCERYDYVDLDSYIIMPNHIHGIIVIKESTDSLSGRYYVLKKRA